MSLQDRVVKLQGVVYVEDIQANIDLLVDSINDLIQKIRYAKNQLTSVDPTKGAAKISGPDYTLTCYALRHLLLNYQKKLLFGCTAVEVNGDVITFPGLYVNEDGTGCTQIKSQKLTNVPTGNGSTDLYVDSTNGNLTFITSEGNNKVTLLDWQRGMDILNTTQDNLFINPDTSPIVSMVRNKFGANDRINEPTDRSYFFLPDVPYLPDNSTAYVTLDGVQIFYKRTYSMNKRSVEIFSYCPIFIPKGLQGKTNTSGGNNCKALYFKLNNS
jgi:hypothetical protein